MLFRSEQASAGKTSVGPATDVYALGGLLYFMVTGRPPFLADHPETVLYQVMHDEPVGLRRLNPAVPRDLEVICLKCLQKEAGRRYASAGAVAGDLERFLRREPIRARPIGALGRGWRWGRRNPARAMVASGLMIALALGFVGVIWQWRQSEAHATAERRERYH